MRHVNFGTAISSLGEQVSVGGWRSYRWTGRW